jgi:hypothetical protein
MIATPSGCSTRIPFRKISESTFTSSSGARRLQTPCFVKARRASGSSVRRLASDDSASPVRYREAAITRFSSSNQFDTHRELADNVFPFSLDHRAWQDANLIIGHPCTTDGHDSPDALSRHGRPAFRFTPARCGRIITGHPRCAGWPHRLNHVAGEVVDYRAGVF